MSQTAPAKDGTVTQIWTVRRERKLRTVHWMWDGVYISIVVVTGCCGRAGDRGGGLGEPVNCCSRRRARYRQTRTYWLTEGVVRLAKATRIYDSFFAGSPEFACLRTEQAFSG